MRQTEFFDASQQWIDRENIGPDSTPSTMPPTRAQIRRASPMVSIESVNVNNDPLSFLRSFLEQAGVESGAAEKLLGDIFASRRDTTAGLTHATLAALLKKHGLEERVAIQGHAQLVKSAAIL